jgi:hypothetical protein
MLVSNRDCSRTASSRRQLFTVFTRSRRSSGELFSWLKISDTRKK